MKSKMKFPTSKWKVEYWWIVLLLAALILLLATGGVLTDVDPEKLAPWNPPAVVSSTPTPAATPGWWDNLPTPNLLYPKPALGGSS